MSLVSGRAFCCVSDTRTRLCSALAKHGGVAAVARRAGLAYRKVRSWADSGAAGAPLTARLQGPTGQRYRGPELGTLDEVRRELAALADAGVCAPRTVPSCKELVAAGKTGLYVRLCGIAGGMAPLAKLLHFSYTGRKLRRRDAIPPSAILASQDGVDAALRALVAANAAAQRRRTTASAYADLGPPLMPSRRAIRESCGEEVWTAIELVGGARVVAKRLGWRVEARGRPRGAPA